MSNDTSNGGCDDSRPSFGSGASNAGGDSLDAFFEATNRRSRCVLSLLESTSVTVMELEELVDHVVECEIEAGLATDTEEHRQRVGVALHHNRLPKLAGAGVIDYDWRSKAVRYWGDDFVSAFPEPHDSEERP